MKKVIYWRSLYLLCALVLLLPLAGKAKQFEVFDGQFYNGLYYPLIDMIEWQEENGAKPHMEFHIHSKERRLEISAVPGDKNGKPVLWLMIELPFRNERVCRHVLAPLHFREGMKLYAYRDDSDSDYDNIFVSTEPMKPAKNRVDYTMPTYQRCSDEQASNKPEVEKPAERQPASVPAAAPMPSPEKKDGKDVGIDYDNQAVPFSF